MLFKKISLCICLIFCCLSVNGEVREYKANALRYGVIRQNNEYNWDDWEEVNIKITFDITSDIITIYNNCEHSFYLKSIVVKKKHFVSFEAITGDGMKVTVILAQEEMDGGDLDSQLQIFIENSAFIYSIRSKNGLFFV